MSNAIEDAFADAIELGRLTIDPEPPTTPLAKFASLHKQRQALEQAMLKLGYDFDGVSMKIGGPAANLAEQIINEWADTGQTNANIQGLSIFIEQKFYCNRKPGVDAEMLAAALESEGYGDLVKPNVNAMSLTSRMKELVADGGDLPATLDAVLATGQRISLKARKS